MKSCFTLYDIANTILERMKPSKEQEYLFFAGFFKLKAVTCTLRAKERGNGIQGRIEKPDQ